MTRSAVLFLACYLAAAFLTGGHYVNHRCTASEIKYGACGPQGITVGMFWPAYWAGRAALEVTK